MTSSDPCTYPTTATSNEITMTVTSGCTFTPSNITVSGFNILGPNGTYTPNGTVNGTPAWLFSAFGGKIQWSSTNNRWEISTTDLGIVSTNSMGSITNLPCSTGWVDVASGGTVSLSGGCGSLLPPTVTPYLSPLAQATASLQARASPLPPHRQMAVRLPINGKRMAIT